MALRVSNPEAGWVNHVQDINDKITKAEKQIKILQTRELSDAYSMKIQEAQRVKDEDRRRREEEAQEIGRQKAQYDNDMNRMRSLQSLMKNDLASMYQQSIDDKKRQELERKLRDQREEEARIAQGKHALELEKQNQRQKLENYQREAHQLLQQREMQRLMKKDEDLKAREDYQSMVAQNAMKDQIKEENYRNFFKRCHDSQNSAQALHSNQVLSTAVEKNRAIDAMIRRNEEDYHRKQLEDDAVKQRRKLEERAITGEILREQIRQKEALKYQEKLAVLPRTEESVQQSAEYNKMLANQRNEKRQQQLMYKDILDKQKEEKDQIVSRTFEKSLTLNPSSGLLVPGIANSKYIHPYSPEARFANVIDYKIKSEPVTATHATHENILYHVGSEQDIARKSMQQLLGNVSPGGQNNNHPSTSGSNNNASYLAAYANNNLLR